MQPPHPMTRCVPCRRHVPHDKQYMCVWFGGKCLLCSCTSAVIAWQKQESRTLVAQLRKHGVYILSRHGL